jgi:hypothetical protein
LLNNSGDDYDLVDSKIDSLINENGNKTKQFFITSALQTPCFVSEFERTAKQTVRYCNSLLEHKLENIHEHMNYIPKV